MHTKLHFKWLSKIFNNYIFFLIARQKAKNIALLMVMLGWCFLGFGQGNTCATATPLTIDGTCDSGTTVGATQSIPAISCNGFTGNADDDVWYSFLLPHQITA